MVLTNPDLLNAGPDGCHRLPFKRLQSALYPVELKSGHASGAIRERTQGVQRITEESEILQRGNIQKLVSAGKSGPPGYSRRPVPGSSAEPWLRQGTVPGVYQIGDVHPRSWIETGSPVGTGTPSRTASSVLQRGVGISSTRT